MSRTPDGDADPARDGAASAGASARAGESGASAADARRYAAYWRRNVRYVAILLTVWFVVSYGFGILLVEPLNRITIPGTGFPLGFWFAQQGSIWVFVVLIFVYVWLMNRLDREFDVDEAPDEVRPAPGGGVIDAGGGP